MSTSPGVYWFLDGRGNVLYVGKAKNLVNRLRQYANEQDDRPQIGKLLAEIAEVKFQELGSELEALLVEAELIRRYQPPYNILLKDDKSSLYICIGTGNFPKIFTARKPEILRSEEKWTTFGPFQSGYKVKQVLEIARRIFKWCDKPKQMDNGKLKMENKEKNQKFSILNSQFSISHKPCFYYHLGLCSGACVGKISSDEYSEMIASLKQFLRGKTSELVKKFRDDIAVASASQAYEKAGVLRDQLEALTVVTSPKYRLRPDMTIPVLTNKKEEEALISLRSILRSYISIPASAPLTRIEGYDISNIQGTNASCSMVTAINGKMEHSEYKHFGIRTLDTPNDYAMLREALTRRQNHPEWGVPDIILIDGGKGQLRSVLSVWKWPSIVISIAKKPDRLIIPIQGERAKGKEKRKNSTAPALAPAPLPFTLSYKEIPLDPDLPASRLLQSIRDESHRFAKRLHTIKRNNALLPS